MNYFGHKEFTLVAAENHCVLTVAEVLYP